MNLPHGSLDGAIAESAARAIGASLRQAATEATKSEEWAREGERLRRTVMQSRPTMHASRWPHWALAATLAAGLVLAIGFSVQLRSTSPVQVEAFVGASHVPVATQYVATSEGQPTELRFSDGSAVKVLPGARVRIEELLSTGATLLVEKGQADVRVRHRGRSTRWRVLAGPFSIAVTGTQFNVDWNPAAERLVVELREGRVEIDGPKFVAPSTLEGGQRFEATAGQSRWMVSPMTVGADSSAPSPGTTQPPVSAVEKETPVVKQASPAPARRVAAQSAIETAASQHDSTDASASAQAGRQWQKLVARGEFRQVTREADAMGLMVCLANCSASDLRALADASRYTGRLDTAEAALRVLYDKHPAHASTAAYLLGVVDESRGRNSSALRWYEDYLARSSTGAFVPEARASRLRMLVATGGNAAARQAAREYLDKYPSGSGASLAVKVLEGR